MAQNLITSTVLLLTFIGFSLECCIQQDGDYCFSRDPIKPQIYELSSKTAYQLVKGLNFQYRINGCKPAKLWLLSRHGTRYPSAKFINNVPSAKSLHQQIVRNLDAGLGELCPEDVVLLKSWKWNDGITPGIQEFLTQQGWDDLVKLAETYKALIQEFTPLVYDPAVFEFRHTNTQRTNASFRGFYEGLFGTGSSEGVPSPPIPDEDLLLRPYEVCPAFDERGDNKIKSNLFENGPEMQQVVREVSARLGTSLTTSQVDQIWDLCRYEQAWELDLPSPWCVAFTYENNQVLEYAEDLRYYYKAGYGYAEHRTLMCEAMQDMLSTVSNKDGPKVTAYFSHSSALSLMLTALDWDRDETPLDFDNYSRMGNRLWRSSVNGPFTANIGVVRYECDNGEELLRWYMNEKLRSERVCRDAACSVETWLNVYREFVDANCPAVFCQ